MTQPLRFVVALLGACFLILGACGAETDLSADDPVPSATTQPEETPEATAEPDLDESAATLEPDETTEATAEPDVDDPPATVEPDEIPEATAEPELDDPPPMVEPEETPEVTPEVTPEPQVPDDVPEDLPQLSDAFCDALVGLNAVDDDPTNEEEAKRVMDEFVGYGEVLVAEAPEEMVAGALLWQRLILELEAILIEFNYDPLVLDDDEITEDVFDLTADEFDTFLEFTETSETVCEISI